MNQNTIIPEPEKVKETVAKSRRRRQEVALASLQLEEVIVKLEQENRSRRTQHIAQMLEIVES